MQRPILTLINARGGLDGVSNGRQNLSHLRIRLFFQCLRAIWNSIRKSGSPESLRACEGKVRRGLAKAGDPEPRGHNTKSAIRIGTGALALLLGLVGFAALAMVAVVQPQHWLLLFTSFSVGRFMLLVFCIVYFLLRG